MACSPTLSGVSASRAHLVLFRLPMTLGLQTNDWTLLRLALNKETCPSCLSNYFKNFAHTISDISQQGTLKYGAAHTLSATS